MDKVDFGLKLYGLSFVTFFLIGVALNMSTKKEYRKTLREVWKEGAQIWLSMTAIFLVVLGLGWFLFEVI
ncbi:hypothetical protein Rahaq_4546 (plasmid) [Rahnella aceris]|uniref:Uncharacterized protein n=1 Tax=Rahnella sp. (strain Y9602) TaxID=2703885 RepID=A0A0H3FM67_RAHSY|nr:MULTISPECIES: hypothetical protein [Rahnella]ADW76128.1 hypothetical protein Rahaq_4546 [Rahnella aceris]